MDFPQLFYAAPGSRDFTDGHTTILVHARLLALHILPLENAKLGTVALLGFASFTFRLDPI
jgi:hypothetical protein